MLSALFEFDSDVADAWEYFSFHVVTDADVDRIVGVKPISVDREVVLVATDTLSLGNAILVD